MLPSATVEPSNGKIEMNVPNSYEVRRK
jgi:hypothetical protein